MTSHRRRPAPVAILVAASVALLLAGAGWALWYRETYHLWPGQDIPPRIHWCGRDYDRSLSPPVPLAEAERTLGRPLVAVAGVPPIRSKDLFAAATEADLRREDPSAEGCATLIYLRVDPDRYRAYELQGGL